MLLRATLYLASIAGLLANSGAQVAFGAVETLEKQDGSLGPWSMSAAATAHPVDFLGWDVHSRGLVLKVHLGI